jgi:hypothetical protein
MTQAAFYKRRGRFKVQIPNFSLLIMNHDSISISPLGIFKGYPIN